VFDLYRYGVKVDVWSAGVIGYILLCGFLPFNRSVFSVKWIYMLLNVSVSLLMQLQQRWSTWHWYLYFG